MNEEEVKKEKNRIIIITLAILLLLFLSITIYLVVKRNSASFITNYTDENASSKQVEINLKERVDSNEDEGFTEIVGYGEISLYPDYPFIYLVNPANNTVYLKFDVIYRDQVLYTSGLISPGMMESFNVVNVLGAGKHSLTYEISTYDLDTRERLMTGIKQNQDVYIKK